MRNPLRQAFWWLLAAALGALGITLVATNHAVLGDAWTIALTVPSIAAILFGVVWGLMALLAANGQARLRRGVNALARWSVPPNEWEAFRAANTRRAAEGPGLTGDYTPKPAEGSGVEVIFGRKAVIVDGYYIALRRFAIPELSWVNWLQRPGEPETLEFGLVYPTKTSTVRTALRVPVPLAARDLGVQVFHHFHAMVPRQRKEGLAFRRPWLVIGWGLGVTAASLLVAGVGWMLHYVGDDSDGVMIAMITGIMAALGAAFFTVIILLVVQPWRKRG
jgi:hypothetical protein